MSRYPEDIRFMRLALREGRKGLGRTSPNPPVGAVVVKEGKIIGRGWHRRAGTPHAEIWALREAGEAAGGATLYVTLEPCHHYGRTPPCTEAILKAGIKRVVIGINDPNPKAQGGAEFLRSQGLEVESGVLAEECAYLTRFFLKRVKTGLPWVIAKAALSLDGRLATKTGDSKWITGPRARRYGHSLRAQCDAILVGKKTVLADDPALTCRLKGGRDPWRLVLDSRLSLSPEHQIFRLSSPSPTVLVTTERSSPERRRLFEEKGIKVWVLPESQGKVDLLHLLKRMGEEGLLSLLVEGGAEVHGSFFDSGLVDEIFFFYGPVIIGGKGAPAAILGEGPSFLKEASWLQRVKLRRLDQDFLVSGLLRDPLSLL